VEVVPTSWSSFLFEGASSGGEVGLGSLNGDFLTWAVVFIGVTSIFLYNKNLLLGSL
jgi:hypothetical protein